MLCKPPTPWLAAAGFMLAAGANAQQAAVKPTVQEPAEERQPLTQESPRRTLFEQHQQLEEKLTRVLQDGDDAARAFGQLLPSGDRRRLQAGCSSLARNPDNAEARALLRAFIDHHPQQQPQVVARYCLDPSLHQLQREVRATRRALQEGSGKGEEGEFNFRFQLLQRAAEDEQRRYAIIHKILLAVRASDSP